MSWLDVLALAGIGAAAFGWLFLKGSGDLSDPDRSDRERRP